MELMNTQHILKHNPSTWKSAFKNQEYTNYQPSLTALFLQLKYLIAYLNESQWYYGYLCKAVIKINDSNVSRNQIL